MFRNYLAAALRNLSRNRLYAGINIIGLGVGFAAALLIALFIRDEFSYDTWMPGHERTYYLTQVGHPPGQKPLETWFVAARFPALLKLDSPQIETMARIASYRERPTGVRNGDNEALERLWWADANFFDVFPLPTVAGDLKAALQRPDGLVITRRTARKYFGRDDPIGETLEIDRKYSMRVAAVIEDLPSNTNLVGDIWASGLASYSRLNELDALGTNTRTDNITFAYFRLKPGAAIGEMERAQPDFIDRHFPSPNPATKTSTNFNFAFLPMADVHLHPAGARALMPSGDLDTIYALAAIGILIVLVASINFVNLMTARATRRAVEVGIRKVSGAGRRDLIVQFIGESLIYVVLGMIVAIGLVELSMPTFNGFLQRGIVFDFWRDSRLAGGMLGVIVLVGLLAGFYPAFVLSAFRPAAVLKGGIIQASGSGSVRQILVVLQFAILIALILVTGIIYSQTMYAVNDSLRLDQDQVVVIDVLKCDETFKDQLRALPGVGRVACAGAAPLVNISNLNAVVDLKDGNTARLYYLNIDFDFFELFGFKPLAGRFFSREHPSDYIEKTGDEPNGKYLPKKGNIVINETAVRALGYTSSQAAVGQIISEKGVAASAYEIVGVVADFPLQSLEAEIPPIFYLILNDHRFELSVKMKGGDVPGTLKAIDKVWSRYGDARPIHRVFLDQYMQNLYVNIVKQVQMFAGFAIVAVFVACLGLFGLSAFTAERRTKEIGIRKAMGATRWDIVKLLVWQFTKPILWANLIAWPVSYYFMNRWLHQFVYHIDLSPWIFVASGGFALVIALLTVSVHAFMVAGARPITALRYE